MEPFMRSRPHFPSVGERQLDRQLWERLTQPFIRTASGRGPHHLQGRRAQLCSKRISAERNPRDQCGTRLGRWWGHTMPWKPAMIQISSGRRPMHCIPLSALPFQAMEPMLWFGFEPIMQHSSQAACCWWMASHDSEQRLEIRSEKRSPGTSAEDLRNIAIRNCLYLTD